MFILANSTELFSRIAALERPSVINRNVVDLGPELQCLLRVKEDLVKYFNMLYKILSNLPGSMQYLWSKIPV